jgi:hypothetical protein
MYAVVPSLIIIPTAESNSIISDSLNRCATSPFWTFQKIRFFIEDIGAETVLSRGCVLANGVGAVSTLNPHVVQNLAPGRSMLPQLPQFVDVPSKFVLGTSLNPQPVQNFASCLVGALHFGQFINFYFDCKIDWI